MLFIPNLNCIVTKRDGFDLYGQPIVGVSKKEKCAIVKLITKTDKTPIRADASASRGTAMEQIADAVILVPHYSSAEVSDMLEVSGVKLRVTGKFPRHSISGNLDHYQLICNIWE